MKLKPLSELSVGFKLLGVLQDQIEKPPMLDRAEEHLEDIPLDTRSIIDESELNRTVENLQKLKGRKIAEALQSEAAFTTSKQKKHIVATYGCGPCVAVGGYDSINKIAFVVHFATEREVVEYGGKILYNIERLAKKKITKPIQLHLRGGVEGVSEGTITVIEKWMMRRSDIPMEVTSKDILDKGMRLGGKSLSINAKNGKVSEYDPLRNPKSRNLTDKTVMHAMMSAFVPNIRISHRPKLYPKLNSCHPDNGLKSCQKQVKFNVADQVD